MILFKRFAAVLVLAARHIFEEKWLSLATLAGLTTAIAMIFAIPFYADAVNFRILTDELARQSANTSRSPFAFLFTIFPKPEVDYSWEKVSEIDRYLSGSAPRELGLTQEVYVRYYQTPNFGLYPEGTTEFSAAGAGVTRISFGQLNGFAEHADVEPAADPQPGAAGVAVLVSAAYAQTYGLQAGDAYIAHTLWTREGETRPVSIPVRIAGVWTPKDPADPYWYYNHQAFDDVLLVPDAEVFSAAVLSQLDGQVAYGVWYFVVDGAGIHAANVDELLRDIARVGNRLEAVIPGASLASSPVEALERYREDVAELTLLLYVFSVPVVGLLIAFVGLVVGQSLQSRQNELAVLRSRGASVLHIVGLAALEGLLLSAAASLLAFPAGLAFARLIGRVRSFLDFSLMAELRTNPGENALTVGWMAIGVVMLFQVVPVLGTARHTILSYKLDQARSGRAPWWQRAGIDFLLLVPLVYGVYQLDRGGGLAAGRGLDPLQNPLLVLFPSFAILAATLLVVRVLPVLMRLVARVMYRTRSVGFLMAVRQLARSTRYYLAPLVLLIMTLSLAIYTATLADTLDRALIDQRFYRVGADLQLIELGANSEESTLAAVLEPAQPGDGALATSFFLPDWEHLEIEGVRAYTRVGQYEGFTDLSGGPMRGRLIGIDRLAFPATAFWRDDFASASLGELMNRLALQPDGLLVDRGFLARNVLRVGDPVNLRLSAGDESEFTQMQIVGVVDYFPSWYPEDADGDYTPLFVANLDYVFQELEAVHRYDIWLDLDEGADAEAVVTGANRLGLQVISWNAPSLEVLAEQGLPERQGLFGVLSVGFLIAALLTVLGFYIYWIFSFKRRYVELGVLQAIGLSVRQMGAVLGWELGLLTLAGGGAGTLLGAAVSGTFIPALQFTEGAEAIPPYLIEISWLPVLRIHLVFLMLFVLAVFALVLLLRRMRIFQAIKLGETV